MLSTNFMKTHSDVLFPLTFIKVYVVSKFFYKLLSVSIKLNIFTGFVKIIFLVFDVGIFSETVVLVDIVRKR